ncbi:MAG: biotin--[acetyl-CoA-carboxylase] ligase [Sulfurospirillum sp.]|nr:biotin--[acetyl-CoA-carboxylase] ligase [Sulfurospirillum sp.]MBL0702416.1 biotin--[acetyl-CoA-carboxylase] ligase [Sulfurospirillum sp.]
MIQKIRESKILPPFAVGVDFQSAGIGSRGNSWEGDRGNFYFSFCIESKELSKDLKLESISIYFAYLLKEVLSELGSKTWLKWPNDFYINNLKIGGVITTKIGNTIIGSIGLNTIHAPEQFGILDIEIKPQKLALFFIKKLSKQISWNNIFSKYKVEFKNSLDFTFHLNGEKKSLREAELLEDGSIKIEKKILYSLR